MNDNGHAFVTPDELRLGLYIELELGWMAHPFPKGSFKITSTRQIETIRGLGLQRVRYVPAKSDLPQDATPSRYADLDADPGQAPSTPLQEDMPPALSAAQQQRRRHAALLDAQRKNLALCDQRFGASIQRYHAVAEQIKTRPLEAARECGELVDGLVTDLLGQGESSIRLLSEGVGDRASMHPVNVTVLCLLLGKALHLPSEQLHDLGTAAFLHDIGKTQLPDKVRWIDSNFSPAEYKQYQCHVAHGVLIAKQMELSLAALSAIAQHHEMRDGSGFPRQTAGDGISLPGKILALVNRYENMCNPARPSAAVTPHEALSQIFSQMKARFDETVLGAFIRMMGVYPPGSVVQLSDGRFALVVSVNSARPLRPHVIVHDPAIPSSEALIVDLEQADTPGIRRSLKPAALPREAMDYLSPRSRICYFFERAVEPGHPEAGG